MSNGIHEVVKDEYEILTISKEGYGCKRTWETINHKTLTQIKVKEIKQRKR